MPTNRLQPPGENSDRPKTTKNITFFKAGDERFKGIQLPINARKYRTLDALLDDLSYKVPGLSFGVRTVATPRGKHLVKNIEQLNHGGSYVCSDKLQARRVKGVKLSQLPGGENHKFRSSNKPPPPPGPPSPRRKIRKSQSPKKHKSIPNNNENRSPRKKVSNKPGRKGRKLIRSKPRDPREAYSAPGTANERRQVENSLSPLDKDKLKHEQRRRVASHSVDTDNFTLPSSNSSDSTTKSPKKKVAKKKLKKKKQKKEEDDEPVFVSDSIEDWQTEEHGKAAVTIQRHYRGYRTRQEMEGKKEAATRIQARYRGYKGIYA